MYKQVITELIQKQELALQGTAGPISEAIVPADVLANAFKGEQSYSAEFIANSNVVKMFEKQFQGGRPAEASLDQQD